jgi:diacylglycerol kinase (ATP)
MNRILSAFFNSMRGLRHALMTEPAVRQELAALALAVVVTPLVAGGLWQAVALVGSVLLILAIELLNTAIEKLSDHVTPELHDTIGYVKDLGSAAVMCALAIAGMVWSLALYERIWG